MGKCNRLLDTYTFSLMHLKKHVMITAIIIYSSLASIFYEEGHNIIKIHKSGLFYTYIHTYMYISLFEASETKDKIIYFEKGVYEVSPMSKTP